MNDFTLYNEDCTEVLKQYPDSSFDLVVTDPPYKTITGGDNNGANSVRPAGMLSGNRRLFSYQNTIKFSEWLPEVYRVLKEGTHCYIFTNSLNMKDLLIESENVGFKLHNILVWEKNNCTPSQFYMKNCEYVLFLRKGKAKWINNIGSSKTVHHFDNVRHKEHPTEKPVDLLKFYIANSSHEGDVVLDPFMGCGSTGIACNELNRRFVGIEIDKEYYDKACKKLYKHP